MLVKQEDKKYCPTFSTSPSLPLPLSPLSTGEQLITRREGRGRESGEGGGTVRGDDEALAKLLLLLALEGAKARKLLVALALVELAGEVEVG